MGALTVEIGSVDRYPSLRGRAPLRRIGSTLGVKQSMPRNIRNLDRFILRDNGNKILFQIPILDMYPNKRSHRRHEYLGVIAINRIQRADNMRDTIPVSRTDDRTEVAWIVDPIEDESNGIGVFCVRILDSPLKKVSSPSF